MCPVSSLLCDYRRKFDVHKEKAQPRLKRREELKMIFYCLQRGGNVGVSSLVWEREAAGGRDGIDPFPWPCSARDLEGRRR